MLHHINPLRHSLRSLLFVHLLSFVPAHAQSSEPDVVLTNIQASKQDSNRARLYIGLGNSYRTYSPDTAQYCFQRGFQLAKRSQNQRVLSEAYSALGSFYQDLSRKTAGSPRLPSSNQKGTADPKNVEASTTNRPKAAQRQDRFNELTKIDLDDQQPLPVLQPRFSQRPVVSQALKNSGSGREFARQPASQQANLLLLGVMTLLMVIVGFLVSTVLKLKKSKQQLRLKDKEIEKQALYLTDLTKTKDKLFSLISHDLRSPVARLKRDFHQLRSTAQLSPASLKPVDQLENQVDHILDLLTNLLDWSFTQLNGFPALKQPIQLSDAVAETLSQLSPQLTQKDIVLLNQLTDSLYVVANKHQLNSIIRNLLSNAIKFTPVGGFIRLRSEVQDSNVSLQIQDTGIGMSSEQLACLLTEPQVRPGTQGELSTGIGLRLCQALVANQAGSLEVESHQDKGTTVRLQLVAP